MTITHRLTPPLRSFFERPCMALQSLGWALLTLILLSLVTPAQAQITFVSGSPAISAGGSAVGSITIPTPTGLAIGDVMLVFISGQTPVAITLTSTLPAGWSSFMPAATATSTLGKGISILSQYKVATAADVASLNTVFFFSPLARATGIIQAFRGVDASTISASAAANALSTAITAPAVTAVGAAPLIVAAFNQGQANLVLTPPPSMLVQGSLGFSGPSYATTGAGPNGVGIQLAQEFVVAGAGSPRTATSPTADIGAGIEVALKKLVGNFLLTPTSITNPACLAEGFTLTARTSTNATDTLYTGTATLSTSTIHGIWSLVVGAGVFTAGSNGSASYTFAAADKGVAQFKLLNNLPETYAARATDLVISGTSTPVAQTNCNFLVAPATASGSACAPLSFTFTARDAANTVLTGFVGTATLSTSTLHGTWSLSVGTGSFTAGASNSGSASYTFSTSDHGTATLILVNTNTETYTSTAAYGPMSGTSVNVVNSSAGCLGGFALSTSNPSGSTCASASSTSPAAPVLTLSAQTVSGAPYPLFIGTVTLLTSTGHGTWSLNSGAGSFASGGTDSGAASYTFAPSDNGVATFKLVNERSESMVITASSGTATGTVSESFADNVFILTPSDVLLTQVVAARPHAFTASVFKKDATSGVCSVASGYTGSKSLKAWYTPTTAHPTGASPPSISSSSTCAPNAVMGNTSPITDNFTTSVFTSGTATFYLCTSDVGQYALNLSDSSLGYAKTVISGQTSVLTSRPFSLWTDSATAGATPNPSGTASSGSKFTPAQSSFSARVSAKVWVSGQDSTTPGTPNSGTDLSANAVTPSFSAPTTLNAGTLTPAGGALGILSGSALAAASFSSGIATPALTYSEAGSMKITATSTNFLNSSFDVPSLPSSVIGRFYPAALSLVSSSLSPACTSGGFSYMGQPFSLGAQLKASGSAGGLLTNYDATLGYAYTLAPAWRAVDALNGADLGTRVSTGTAPSWKLGLWTYAYSAANFPRLTTGPDGSFDSLQMGLSGSDLDAVPISALDMSFTTAGVCSGSGCNAKTISTPTRARFGRLEVQNVYGSVLTTLRAPVQTLFWSKSAAGMPLGWALNTLDSCTSVPYASMSVGSFSGAVSSVTLPSGNLFLSAGKASITATRTGGANVAGSALLGLNLGTSSASPGGCSTGLTPVPGASLVYLESNFCSASSYLNNPTGKLVWGAAQGKSGSIVFSRETY